EGHECGVGQLHRRSFKASDFRLQASDPTLKPVPALKPKASCRLPQVPSPTPQVPLYSSFRMRFAPEYVAIVLNENFEDAKELLLTPLMAINYAHLVMLAERGIVSSEDARVLRTALDAISLDSVREVTYDGTSEDLFFFIERLIEKSAGED